MDDNAHWHLVLRHLSGTASTDDEAELRAWAAADPARAQELESLREAWSSSADGSDRYDADRAWATFRARIEREREREPVSVPRASTRPGPRRPSRLPSLAAAAAVVLLAGSALVWRATVGDTDPTAGSELEEVVTARGHRSQILLSDGSRVLLGPESRLRAPRVFGGERVVYLEGIASIEVVHDARRRFEVHAAGTVTRVIGTTFVVRAYPGSPVEVGVVEGRVAVRGEGQPEDAGADLGPGDLGRVSADGNVERMPGGADDVLLGWTTGRLTFRNERLTHVISEIERWYDVDVRLSDSRLADRHLTITIDNLPLDQVFDLVALSLDATYERHGRVFTLHPNPASRR